MRIVIDRDVTADGYVMGEHVVHLDSNPLNTLTHQATGLPVQALVWAAHFNSLTPAVRATAGWGVVNQLAGEVAPMTRWARLVAASQAPTALAAVKALNLSGT